MAKVLVTGSEGYIGSVMMPYLKERGHQVSGLDVGYFAEGNLDQSERIDYPLNKKDLRQVEVVDLEGFDAIIHLAGLSNDPLGKLNENLTYDINHQASLRLAEKAKQAGVPRFIFSSSCSLYGQGDGAALTEESAQNPQTAYAKSKVLTEEGLEKLADDKFSPVYLRNATVFGFSPRMRFDLVVNSLTGFAHSEGVITILGDGKPWRPLVHVVDVCKAFHTVLEADRSKVHAQAFNVGSSEENYQIKQIAELVQKKYPKCEIKIMQKDAGDTRDYNVSFGKIESVLGYKAEWSVPKGISELQAVFEKIALDSPLFEDRFYTRLKQIKFLLEGGRVNKDLYFQ